MGHPPSAFGGAQLGVVHIPDKFNNWAGGSAQELADVANQVLAETEVPDASLNERLVRHYVTVGVIDPPVRRGRDAIFSLRHLVQLMVVRRLLAERLSLGQIRDVFRTIDWNQVDAVAELLPKPASVTEAERLALQFGGDSRPVQHLLNSKKQQWESKKVTPQDADRLLRWKLNRWCEVLADVSAIQNLTDDQVTQAARYFVASLTDFRDPRRQREDETNQHRDATAIGRQESSALRPSMSGDSVLQVLAEAKKLAQQYRVLTGKPLGITGEVAEYEAARILGVELTPARQAGYDATEIRDGKTYRLQIKGRCVLEDSSKRGQRMGAIDIQKEFDAVLLVLLDGDFEATAIYEAPREAVIAALKDPGSKARNERGALSISKFRSIGAVRWQRAP